MATRQVTSKKTSTVSAEKARAPRVTKVKHSKAAVTETSVETPSVEKSVQTSVQIPQEAIAKIAYGFWEARGYQDGDPAEDWFRAEAEYLQTSN